MDGDCDVDGIGVLVELHRRNDTDRRSVWRRAEVDIVQLNSLKLTSSWPYEAEEMLLARSVSAREILDCHQVKGA